MDLNTILIILGVIALIGLVAHGIWSNRRENSQLFKNSKFERQNANNMQEPEPIKPQQQNIPNFAQSSIQASQATQTAQAVQVEQVEQVQVPQTAQPQTAQNNTAVSTHPANSAHSVEQIKITLPENQPKVNFCVLIFVTYIHIE